MTNQVHIIWKVEAEIGFLIFNNPPGNEMTLEFYTELTHVTSSIIPTSNVKAIIIMGSGRHFSSGAELNSLFENVSKDLCTQQEKTIDSEYVNLYQNLQTFDSLKQLKIPVIAAIRGVCVGAALELAMFCHFRICAEGSVLGLPESTYGLIPGIGGIQNMIALAGQAKAIELILKGNTCSAKQALLWNIIDYIVPKNKLKEVAIKLAQISASDYKPYLKKDYLQLLEKSNSEIQ
jgi:enoyl-CoA hydratase